MPNTTNSPRVTMSGLALLHACQFWARPDVELPPEAPTSDEATRGTAFGALAEAWINRTDAPGPVTLPAEEAALLERMWGHAAAWLQEHRRAGWRAEVAFWWDPATDTGGELPRGEHRDYSAAPNGSLCGTADLVWMADDVVVIADWKTRAPGSPNPDADDQLDGLALAAARAYGCDSARVITLEVTADRGVEPWTRELDALDLAEVAARVRGDLEHAAKGAPDPREGPHCTERYCKALTVCPRATALVSGATEAAQIIPAGSLTRYRYSPAIESPDHLVWMLQARSMLRKYLDQVDAAIDNYVAAGDVSASDGVVVRKTYRNMSSLDQGAMVELLQRKGATDEEIGGCYRSKRVSAGVRAVKAHATKKGRAA